MGDPFLCFMCKRWFDEFKDLETHKCSKGSEKVLAHYQRRQRELLQELLLVTTEIEDHLKERDERPVASR